MSERRFNEAEVAAIFDRATEAQHTSQRQLRSGEGMTLTEIQAIDREVGISPDQLAQAAKARSGSEYSGTLRDNGIDRSVATRSLTFTG